MNSLLLRAVRLARKQAAHIGNPGRIIHGSDFVVGPSLRVARGMSLHVGDRVSIARNFTCQSHAVLGHDIMISSNVAFIGKDHSHDDPDKTITAQPHVPPARIFIQGDNLIGFGSIILGSVTIGSGTIVGAGSLVVRDLPPNTICVGNPARPIADRR